MTTDTPIDAEPAAEPAKASRAARIARAVIGWEYWPALVAAIVVVGPFFAFRYPPMTDYPAHETLLHLMRFKDDPSLYPPGLYALNLGHPNQLMYLLAWPLSFVVGVHVAFKLVVGLALAALPLAVARLAKHMGVSPWAALLSAPLWLGFVFYWGFVANVLGLALLFLALPSLDRFAASPTWSRAALHCLTMGVLYAAHELTLFWAIGALGVMVVASWTGLRRALPTAIPVLFAIAMAVGQSLYQAPLRNRANMLVATSWPKFHLHLLRIPSALFGGYDAYLHAGFIFLAIAALVLMRRGAPRSQTPYFSRTGLHERRFMILGLGFFVLLLSMPASLHGASYLADRHAGPAAILFLLALSPRTLSPPRLLARVTLGALVVATLVSELPQYAAAASTHQELERLMPLIEKDTAIANLDLDSDRPEFSFRRSQIAARVLAERGGRLLVTFTDSSISPAIIARKYRWDEAAARNGVHVTLFRPSFDLQRFRYVLLFTEDPKLLHPVMASCLSPEAKPIASSGKWALFESNILSVPLTGPDSKSPRPPNLPETLTKRLLKFNLVAGGGRLKDFVVDDVAPPDEP